jgi:hypothetical protein
MHDMTGRGIRDCLIALSVVRTLTHPVLPGIPVVESAAVGMIVCQMNWCETGNAPSADVCAFGPGACSSWSSLGATLLALSAPVRMG